MRYTKDISPTLSLFLCCAGYVLGVSRERKTAVVEETISFELEASIDFRSSSPAGSGYVHLALCGLHASDTEGSTCQSPQIPFVEQCTP